MGSGPDGLSGRPGVWKDAPWKKQPSTAHPRPAPQPVPRPPHQLADGIRFAGARAATALDNVKAWDHQLSNDWTTADAFCHVAAVAGALDQYYGLLGGDTLNGMDVAAIAANNDQAIVALRGTARAALREQIVTGHEASARFVESLDENGLTEVVTLGDYEMSKGDIVEQIWINHQIAHAYEASARWPL